MADTTILSYPTKGPTTVVSRPGTASLIATNIAVRGDSRAVVRLSCEGDSSCAGTLALSARRIIRGRRAKRTPRPVEIGDARFSIPAGRTAGITVRLDARGRALLKAHHGRLAAHLRIEPDSGEAQARDVRLVEKTTRGHRNK